LLHEVVDAAITQQVLLLLMQPLTQTPHCLSCCLGLMCAACNALPQVLQVGV
jgi:hypothetical protein